MTALSERNDAQRALNGRTDYAVCTCTNGKHNVTEHVRHASPDRPSRNVVEAMWPTGHIIQHHINWSPWTSA